MEATEVEPKATALDRRLFRYINTYCGAPRTYEDQRWVENELKTRHGRRSDTIIFGKRIPGDPRITLPSAHAAHRHHNATSWRDKLRPLRLADVSAMRRGEFELHVTPRRSKLGGPPSILIRFDADAHSGQTDAGELIRWASREYFGGLVYDEPSANGWSGWLVVQADWVTNSTITDTGEIESEIARFSDGSPVPRSQVKINALLGHVECALRRAAKAAGFKSSLEIKGRFHIVKRDLDDDAIKQVADYGQPVKMPVVPTDADMDRLEAAVVADTRLIDLLRRCDAKTAHGERVGWNNALAPADTPQHRADRLLNQTDAPDPEDVDAWIKADRGDLDVVRDPAADYMKRIGAASRYELREARGDQEAAFSRVLNRIADHNGGPTTGPVHAARRARVRSSLRRAARTFDLNKVGKGKKPTGQFDAAQDAADMMRRQSGRVSDWLMYDANARHPHARLTRLKLAQITIMIQKSIVTGTATHVSTAGLKALARHLRVQFPGVTGSAIAAAKEVLTATRQLVRLRGHRFAPDAGVHECERWKLGPRAVLQTWIKPLLSDEVMAEQTNARGHYSNRSPGNLSTAGGHVAVLSLPKSGIRFTTPSSEHYIDRAERKRASRNALFCLDSAKSLIAGRN